MAGELRWSPEAVEDIESIAAYIARDSRFYADAVASRLVELAEFAAEQPLSGRMVPEIGRREYRELLAYRYRLIYQLRTDAVLILAVIHGARQLLPGLENRLSD